MSGQLDLPDQSPLFHAQQARRYERQRLIAEYEAAFDCRLIVLIDAIFPYSTTFLEELIFDAKPTEDLHLLLNSPGGDGETAVRLVRSCQARCRELTVIVPDLAKSAGTLLAIGAHHIVMGPMKRSRSGRSAVPATGRLAGRREGHHRRRGRRHQEG